MPSRRTFLKVAASAALIPLVNIDIKAAQAAEKVSPKDATAIALKFEEDASKSTNRADKQGVAAADQYCDNCQYYTADAGTDGWGGCALFQNKLVPAKGWCMGWTHKAG
ncbi:MAG TPA: high-potential iron-sulfur protein [Pseudomonadales bacterium]|nr:high-potential iron-sulfur protein [Pseudomonadales bacterium]